MGLKIIPPSLLTTARDVLEWVDMSNDMQITLRIQFKTPPNKAEVMSLAQSLQRTVKYMIESDSVAQAHGASVEVAK